MWAIRDRVGEVRERALRERIDLRRIDEACAEGMAAVARGLEELRATIDAAAPLVRR